MKTVIKNIGILIILLIAPIWLQAQNLNFLSDPNAVSVIKDGQPLENPWAGGINYAQFSALDVDLDGQDDIFIFDRSGGKVITFLVKGDENNPVYEFTDEYNANFPQLRDWAILYDYDCDGYPDIFTYMPGGIKVFRNTSGETGNLSFEQITPANTPPGSPMYSNYQPNYVNLFVSSVNIPAFVDVDGDGDMDILTFGLWGTAVEYHKNLSMEKYGHCDSLDFEVRNHCWGYFRESMASNQLFLFDTCNYNVDNPEFTHPANNIKGLQGVDDFDEEERGLRHEGATMCGLDANGNGLTDLILGDIEYKTLSLLINGGEVDAASIVDQDNEFPSYDVSVNLPEFPGAYFVDVDNDGEKDLIVSPNTSANSQNFESVWYYKNIGSTEVPVFEFQKTNFLQDQMIDVGEASIPVFVDINQDGKMDVVVSNYGYYSSSHPFSQQLMLMINVGTETEPEFEVVDEDFLNISQHQLGLNLAPAFADLNNDGKPDMILGDMQGRLHYFVNTSDGNDYSFDLQASPMTDNNGNVIDAGTFAAPFMVDLDRDGTNDLLIGCKNGNIWYYENTGNENAHEFTLSTDSLGNMTTALSTWPHNGYSTPVVHEVDGAYHLFAGSRHGNLYHYANIEDDINGDYTLTNTSAVNYQGIRVHATIADLNDNGELDLILGNYRGGLSYFSEEVLTADFSVGQQTICAGDTLQLMDESLGNPTAWSWTIDGAEPSSSNDQNPSIVFNSPGTYDVTLLVENNEGETDQKTLENFITVHALPNVDILVNEDLICNSLCNGELEVAATGEEPLTYLWSNEATGTVISELCEGNYQVTVTDGNGCVQTAEHELTAPELDITYDLTLTPASCGEADGCAEIANIDGGTDGPYTVTWEDGSTENSYCELYAGVYGFTIEDGNGCTFDFDFEIINPDAPVVELEATDVTCGGDCDGTLQAAVLEGQAPYQYNWSDGLSDQDSQENICEGTYSVYVIDDNLCQSSSVSIAVEAEYALPVIDISASDTVVDLEINPIVDFTNNTTNATSYLWNFGDGNQSQEVNPSHEYTEEGTFIVTMTATNGPCSVTDSIEVVVIDPTSVPENLADRFNLYPNPVQNNLTVEGEGAMQVRVFSISGQLMYSNHFIGDFVLDVSGYSTGLYFMQIETSAGMAVKKFNVIH